MLMSSRDCRADEWSIRTQAKPTFIVVDDDGYFRTQIHKQRKRGQHLLALQRN
jgi:hypothetical protein